MGQIIKHSVFVDDQHGGIFKTFHDAFKSTPVAVETACKTDILNLREAFGHTLEICHVSNLGLGMLVSNGVADTVGVGDRCQNGHTEIHFFRANNTDFLADGKAFCIEIDMGVVASGVGEENRVKTDGGYIAFYGMLHLKRAV